MLKGYKYQITVIFIVFSYFLVSPFNILIFFKKNIIFNYKLKNILKKKLWRDSKLKQEEKNDIQKGQIPHPWNQLPPISLYKKKYKINLKNIKN